MARLFADAKAALGEIDIAVNTAGKVLRKPIIETTEDEYDSMFDINSKAAYFFIKEAGAHLADGGKIITIMSLAGGIVGLASGRFSLGQVAIPVGVGVGAGTGIPIVTAAVTGVI